MVRFDECPTTIVRSKYSQWYHQARWGRHWRRHWHRGWRRFQHPSWNQSITIFNSRSYHTWGWLWSVMLWRSRWPCHPPSVWVIHRILLVRYSWPLIPFNTPHHTHPTSKQTSWSKETSTDANYPANTHKVRCRCGWLFNVLQRRADFYAYWNRRYLQFPSSVFKANVTVLCE